MSSYISSFESHRRFVLGLLALVLVLAFGLFCLGVYLQPLSGDLTRIGSYAEKDFGWNKPQLEFQPPLSEIGRYEHYYDVVVLGDSFSTGRPHLRWQNYLVAAKGWSIATLDTNKIHVEQILENPVFRKTPPKIFILENVERDLPLLIKHDQSCDATDLLKRVGVTTRPSPVTAPFHVRKFQGLANYVKRETAWYDIKLGYVRDYLWNSLLRKLLGDAHTDAVKVGLEKKAPFSSVNQQALLVYKDDLRKVAWWRKMNTQEISCQFEKIRKQVEANGQTRFVLMVAPDKLTAYADFLLDKGLRDISALSELSGHLPGVMPRLDQALISAIREGEQDVYLPDDTHWGSSGNLIAAETLLTFLLNP
ncbi:hypothetical protein [Candidatus Nitrotoga sp. 1052]|uniref:hypothetical protein n=1 Tax=Candidatus Nitrotoga sp. 1052 TaxID=2886964 RepID=UPI001EF74436|nr:hypothetical protein [Candidatus Nitrotoga sp. 1052]CAH1073952.1 conserved hypothetical protein [Candidatus Nitrotoga sp. 1052]